jgi:hypothetical protein
MNFTGQLLKAHAAQPAAALPDLLCSLQASTGPNSLLSIHHLLQGHPICFVVSQQALLALLAAD